MSTTTSQGKNKTKLDGEIRTLISLLSMIGVVFLALLGTLWFTTSPAGLSVAQSAKLLFATDSTQAWWYVTRAAGLTAYILLWLSMVWGLVLPTKFFHSFLEGHFSYDFHEFLSLLGLGFVLLHVIVLLFDQYLPFSVWQILIPFTDRYRPIWVGLGILGFYMFLLVTVTFYIRKWIGAQIFRTIHTFSLLGYLGATLHGLFAGTDSALPFTKVLYSGTFLVILFLTVYWVVMGMFKKDEERQLELKRRLEKNRQRNHSINVYGK